MADFAPPTGPPPPKVPEGWKAVWNDTYKEWFYVNTHTKKSQWDKPTEPVYAAPADGAPAGPPPTYDHSSSKSTGSEKSGLGSNNPYGGQGTMSDEDYARKLQAEENARVSDRGASDSYYQGGQSSQYGQQPAYGQQAQSPYGQQQQQSSPAPPEKRGLFSKLSGKLGGGSSAQRPPQQGGYGGYPPQQQGYPPQNYGGYQQGPQYGQAMGGGGYQGYYPQQQQRPQKSGGLGAGGGALLGAGAGLLGGALLMDAIDDHEDQAYQQGYDNGENADDGGGDGGGDFGGGDDF